MRRDVFRFRSAVLIGPDRDGLPPQYLWGPATDQHEEREEFKLLGEEEFESIVVRGGSALVLQRAYSRVRWQLLASPHHLFQCGSRTH